MSEQRAFSSMGFPRPGKVLRGVLWLVAGLAIFWAIVVRTVPAGEAWFSALVFSPELFLHGQVWRIFTAGLLSPPSGNGAVSHLMFTLIGLYFLSPDLERRWGGARFAGFLMASLVTGFLLALAATRLPFGDALLHQPYMYGMGAAITGTAVAWSQENADAEVRLFFVLPVRGRQLLWLTVAWCVLCAIFADGSTEGVIAPFGGVLAGFLLGGSPSPVRALYLQWKLSALRKQRGGVTAQSILDTQSSRRRPGSPPLRVVRGGITEESPRREPPPDKRYLN